MKKTIAHFLEKGIKQHQFFIYQQITSLKDYRSIVIGPFSKEENYYSFDQFYNLNEIDDFPRFIQEQNIVAFHAHHGGESLEFLPYLQDVELPYIVSIRGRDGSAFGKAQKKNLKRYAKFHQLNERIYFFPVCKYLAQNLEMLHFSKESIKVLYGGINVSKFPYKNRTLPTEENVRIISVGRLVEKKGFDQLILAFIELNKKYPNTIIDIVGFGEEEKKLKKMVRKANLQNAVIFHGQLSADQLVKKMDAAHLFCLASKTSSNGDVEGIPNSLKEAMACGLPVLSTTHGGINELIHHLENGYLANEQDPQTLLQGFEFYIENPHRWGDITRKARQTIEDHFELTKQIRYQESLYDQVINQSKRLL